jgi:cyclomaltodextrinase
VLFLMCYPGAPCIYYGDEVGMMGGKDPDCRRAFQWDEGRWNLELREYVKACIALRREHPALCRGEVMTLYAKGMVFALGRRLTASEEHAGSSHEETLIAVFNTGKSPWDLDVPVEGYLSEGAVLQGLWGEGQASVGKGRLRGLEVPARRGVVLQLEG